jgi:hypothetical protein
MGRDKPQSRRPCADVSVRRCISDHCITKSAIDYYYYATAGGAKIWVRLY